MGNSVRFPQRKPAAAESCYPTLLINYKVHAGSFRVSVIHRDLTWTTGSLTCVRNHSYACVFTRGVGHSDNVSAHHFDLEKLSQFFLVLLTGFEPRDGVRTSGLWISSPILYLLSRLGDGVQTKTAFLVQTRTSFFVQTRAAFLVQTRTAFLVKQGQHF